MKSKCEYVLCMGAIVLCLLGGHALAQGHLLDKDKASPTKSKKVSVALIQVDAARSWKEWEDVLNEMEQVDKDNRVILQSYINDEKHDGRKRFSVFKVLHKTDSLEEMRNEIKAQFKKENNVDFRVSLAQEMGRDKSDFYNDQLSAALRAPKEHPFVKVSAAMALATHGDNSGKSLALDMVKEATPYSDFAIQALAIMKATELIPEISAEMLRTKDYWKRNTCRLAILRIEVFSAPEEKKIDLLAKALTEDGYFEARQWAARKLSEIGSPAAAQVLVRTAKDKQSVDKNAALTGLELGVVNKKWAKSEVEVWLKN